MRTHAIIPIVAMFLAFMFLSPSAVKARELHDAVKARNVVVVKLRLTEGADVNALDLFGTPLHIAASRNSVDIAKVLIDGGANLEAEAVEDQKRAHPLHTAAQANAAKVAELLISRGAQVNARNADGATPLFVAASNGQAEVAEVLLKAGADPLAEDSLKYDTPMHVAAFYGRLNVVQLLFSHGVDVNLRSKHYGTTPLWEATN